MNRQKQLIEARKRMELMEFDNRIILALERKDTVVLSKVEYLRPDVPIVELSILQDSYLEHVKNYEKETDSLVYFTQVADYGEVGTLLTMYYVSSHPHEWDSDKEYIKTGYDIAHVENLTYQYLSETGSVGFFKIPGGTILRSE